MHTMGAILSKLFVLSLKIKKHYSGILVFYKIIYKHFGQTVI